MQTIPCPTTQSPYNISQQYQTKPYLGLPFHLVYRLFVLGGWVMTHHSSYISYQIHLSSRACNSTWSTMYKVKPWMDLLVSPCSVFQTLARGSLVFVIVVCYSWFSQPATSKDANQYLRLTIRSSIFCICRGFCSKMGGRRWSLQLVMITQAVLQLEEARWW